MTPTELNKLKTLFGDNFLGPNELRGLMEEFSTDYNSVEVPQLKYSWDELERYAKDYILVIGIPMLYPTNLKITIRTLREKFGFDSNVAEPCFYNQDWYMSEDFIDKTLESVWYLIKKDVYEDTRAEMPFNIMSKGITFPSAILCTYTFFAYYFAYGKMLWYHDFIWCSDVDHNGDRIYVGKYHDIDAVNKNGFSVHRHLALRPCYAAVDMR